MKIISYNILNGAPATTAELAQFVRGEDPDLLCIQEANGWDADGWRPAREFAADVGLPHIAPGKSNTPYNLITFSRFPLLETQVVTAGLWHSAVRVRVSAPGGTLDAWSVHLDPRAEDRRVAEAGLLLSALDPATDTVLMGDFNSLSPVDVHPSDLAARLRAKGISKFGEREPRHDVMGAFADAGLVDTAHALGSAAWSVPTPANTDVFHADRLRLDYLLADAGAAARVTSVEVARTHLTDRISDHYPLVIALD